MVGTARILRRAALVAGLALAGCELDTTEPIPDEPMTLVGADLQGRLWMVDEASGVTTFLDSVLIQWPASFPPSPPRSIGPIQSMAWVPTIDAWWLGTARDLSGCPNCLYRYHASEDSARLVRSQIEEVDTLADFAVQRSTGRLYTFKRNLAGYLFRVELSGSFLFREVMRLNEGETGKGSAFWTDGNLYVSGGRFEQVLLRVEIERATTAQVGPVTYVGFPPFATYTPRIVSLATRWSDGVMLGLVVDDDATYLATVDPTNAVAMHVAETTVPLSALAYVPTRLVP